MISTKKLYTKILKSLKELYAMIGVNNSAGVNGLQKAQGWTVISSAQGNLDLNGITNFGVYYCNSSTTAGNVQNRPPVSANLFKLEVKGFVANASKDFVIIEQTYTTVVANVFSTYKRYTNDGGTTWRDWRETTFMPSTLTATDDFDNIIIAGTYAYNNSTANKPTGTTTGGALLVQRYNASYIKQIAFPNGTTPRMCVRYLNNGTWGAWYEATLTQMT